MSEDNNNQRIDKFLIKTFKHLPYTLICKCLRKGIIKSNKKKINNNYIIKSNDIISIFLKDEIIDNNNKIDITNFQNLDSQMKNIPIIYEDENILLVNKPSGIIVHEDQYNKKYNLINIIKSYFYKNKLYDPNDNNSFPPALCNRIDRNTCGIVLIAKNFQSLKLLNHYIKLNKIKKKYISIIIGNFKHKEIIINNFLYKNQELNKVFIKNYYDINVKQAITKIKLIYSNKSLSIIECELITGRTHQIRAQLSHLGFPILGDGKYGIEKINKEYSIFNQCLCSYSIQFNFNNKTNKEEKNHLSYLNNKIFSININDIPFMKKVKKYLNKEF